MKTYSGHKQGTMCINLSPDGKSIVSCGYDKTIKIWNIENGGEIKTFNGHKDIVQSVSYSPDQKFIISGSKDK